MIKMGEKHRMTHTQTFFPESLILDVLGRSPGLRLIVYLPIFDLRFKIFDLQFIKICNLNSIIQIFEQWFCR